MKKNKKTNRTIIVRLNDVVDLQNIYMYNLNKIARRQRDVDKLPEFDIKGAHKEIYECPEVRAQLKKMYKNSFEGQNRILAGVISGSWDFFDHSFTPIVKALASHQVKVVKGKELKK